jgi:metal-responsive CopG/Arc/MetJ family transcriptional regulator
MVQKSQKTKQVTVTLYEQTIDAVDGIAKIMKCNRSRALEQLLVLAIDDVNQKPKDQAVFLYVLSRIRTIMERIPEYQEAMKKQPKRDLARELVKTI